MTGLACFFGWKAEVARIHEDRLPDPPVATFLEQWVVET